MQYVIDGNDFSTLDEFYDVVSRIIIPRADWGHNPDWLLEIIRDHGPGGAQAADKVMLLLEE